MKMMNIENDEELKYLSSHNENGLMGYLSIDPFNIKHIKLEFENYSCEYEIYKDENNNIEIYIPENEYHTGFYIKFPNNNISNTELEKTLKNIGISLDKTTK